ncbi:MAG TPA: hypothetical protein P5572_08915 [Phycisphaerae bacterium]|nr:hypothetical protein [Phycisphaerae bacterium]
MTEFAFRFSAVRLPLLQRVCWYAAGALVALSVLFWTTPTH